MRKEDAAEWIQADRIKGLFKGQSPDRQEPVAGSENAGDGQHDVKAVLDSAVAAMGTLAGRVRSLIPAKSEASEQPDAPKVVLDLRPPWIRHLLCDGQNADVVAKVFEEVRQILMSDEEVLYIAVQSKPVVNLFPDCVILTNRRFIVYRQKLLGQRDFEDCVWRELADAQLKENVIGATLTLKTARGQFLSLDYLPKAQARKLYRHAQEMEERSLEERRTRALEDKRAAAGGVFVQNTMPTVGSSPSASVSREDPVQTLGKLKQLLDAGLITPAEYDAKKSEVLSRM